MRMSPPASTQWESSDWSQLQAPHVMCASRVPPSIVAEVGNMPAAVPRTPNEQEYVAPAAYFCAPTSQTQRPLGCAADSSPQAAVQIAKPSYKRRRVVVAAHRRSYGSALSIWADSVAISSRMAERSAALGRPSTSPRAMHWSDAQAY